MEKIFSGYSKTWKQIQIILDNNSLYVIYLNSGYKRKLNQEFYNSESDFESVKIALLNDGFKLNTFI